MHHDDMLTAYEIQATGGEGIPVNLFYYAAKDELRISPSGRLCGFASAAMIESKVVAERFAEALLPRLRKRYGNTLDLEVLCSRNYVGPQAGSRYRKLERQIKEHTRAVLDWLEAH